MNKKQAEVMQLKQELKQQNVTDEPTSFSHEQLLPVLEASAAALRASAFFRETEKRGGATRGLRLPELNPHALDIAPDSHYWLPALRLMSARCQPAARHPSSHTGACDPGQPR